MKKVKHVNIYALERQVKKHAEKIQAKAEDIQTLSEEAEQYEFPELKAKLDLIGKGFLKAYAYENSIRQDMHKIEEIEATAKTLEADEGKFDALLTKLTVIHTNFNLQAKNLHSVLSRIRKHVSSLYVKSNNYRLHVEHNIALIKHVVEHEERILDELNDAVKKLSNKVKIHSDDMKPADVKKVKLIEAGAAEDAMEAQNLVENMQDMIIKGELMPTTKQKLQGVSNKIMMVLARVKIFRQVYDEAKEIRAIGRTRKKKIKEALAICRVLRREISEKIKELKMIDAEVSGQLNEFRKFIEGICALPDKLIRMIIKNHETLLATYDYLYKDADKVMINYSQKMKRLKEHKKHMDPDREYHAAVEYSDLQTSRRRMMLIQKEINQEKNSLGKDLSINWF